MSVLDVVRQRSAFTDALRPPSGFVLGACIGTTFSLDFEIFTAVLMAFVTVDTENPLGNAPAVLRSVARLKSRVRVFVNGGSLRPPATTNRLFALYDRILRPRSIDGGAFHPKVWVLRFDPVIRPERQDAEPIYRVLTASRNVTDSGCWELGALFEGTRRPGVRKFGADVSSFCRKVAGAPDLPAALWRLIEELKSVEFVPPREAANGLRFEWQWPGGSILADRLPSTMSRVLLISPFLRTAFLNRLCERTRDLTIVSTQAELDNLPDEVHDRLVGSRLFVVAAEVDDNSPSLDLHAKLLAWETDHESGTLTGSANATGPGWGCGPNVNCEAMVSLRPGLGIDAVVKAFVAPASDQLRPWIESYVRQPVDADPEQELEKRLDKFKRHLCADGIRGQYDPTGRTLRLVSMPASDRVWPADISAQIVPLLQRDRLARLDYRLVYSTGAVFREIDLEDVAAFAHVVVRSSLNRSAEIGFVVQFALDLGGVAADARDDAVNARLLEGFDARSLLVGILSGVPGGTSRDWIEGRSADEGAFGPAFRKATIERILEACTADPIRVHEVEAVLAACGKEPGMRTFLEFWATFRAVFGEMGADV